MLRNARGFTLIELMIVCVILGILAAIGIANYMSMQNRARTTQVVETMQIVRLTIEDFATRNNGNYPQNGATISAEGGFTFGGLLPASGLPINPYTNAVTSLDWSNGLLTPPSTDPAGGVSLNTAQSTPGGAFDQYDILGSSETGAPLRTVFKNY